MKGKRRNGLPKHCSLVTDRHKKRRIRFRAKGVDTYLPYPPTGPEFEKAYASALAGVTEWRANIGATRTRPGTIDALVVSYYRSPEFAGLAQSTQQTYRRIIERFRDEHGKRMVRDLRREHVKAILGGMADRPQAANRLLSLFKILWDHALDNGWVTLNPARGVKGYGKKTKGFHTWTEEEIAAYEQRHPPGSKARLALVLLLYTAQRRGDVVAMGWEKIRGRVIAVKQSKTGAELDLYMLPELTDAIRELPRDKPTFLTTEFGKPFTPAGFRQLVSRSMQ
ncbi:tyrosine-type recombinase/integrase [Rhizobium sp. PAMB 3174]